MSKTVRISDGTHQRLVALATSTGRRMDTIVEEAVAAYETSAFWSSFHTAYDSLAGDSSQWEEIMAERGGEASALVDDFDRR